MTRTAKLQFDSTGWVKRWAFISGPYLFVTDHEKDSVVRVVIRLSDITIQFNEDQVTTQLFTAFPFDSGGLNILND